MNNRSAQFRHAVEVEAESLYEDAALDMHKFKQHHCEPGPSSELEIEIRSSIVHTITPKKVCDWLGRSAKNPRDAVLKERLGPLI